MRSSANTVYKIRDVLFEIAKDESSFFYPFDPDQVCEQL